jgi:hypothetical protein
MVTVIIPWRPSPSRQEAFDLVSAWYRRELPHAKLVTVDSDDELFNLARCRNLGVASVHADDEVVVISDADTFPETWALHEAIAGAASSRMVHLPYDRYHWLGPTGTDEFLSGVPAAECDFELVHGACSGVYVTTPATWWAHGGQDERFRGWGYEDAAWHIAHETLLGAPPHRHPGRVFALNHQTEARTGEQYERNAALAARYRDAAGDADQMRRLIDEDIAANARSLPDIA